MKPPQPSALELQVLALLWQRGPMSARAVQEQLPDGKPRAYTTVLTVLQVMEKKGLLEHSTEGNRHVYSPKVRQQTVLLPMLRSLVKHVFGGSAARVMQHLLDADGVSPSELAEMRKLLDEHSRTANASRKGGAK